MADVRNFTLVDNKSLAEEAFQNLSKSRLLSVDTEGSHCARECPIAIIQLCDHTNQDPQEEPHVYLFDIHVLGDWVFDHGLRALLESPEIGKIFFDCRNDADTLLNTHNVILNRVWDLQVLAFMVAPHQVSFLMGLSKAFETFLPNIDSGEREDLRKLYRGDKDIWSKRPLDVRLIQYSVNDVRLFYKLYCSLQSRIYAHESASKKLQWRIASEHYLDLKRTMPSDRRDPGSKYQENSKMPARIILAPEYNGMGSVFRPPNTTCWNCRRAFNSCDVIDLQDKTLCATCFQLSQGERTVFTWKISEIVNKGTPMLLFLPDNHITK